MDKSGNTVKINEIQTNLESVIKKQVIEAVGKIDGMKKIRASNVFDSNWRVDIWCESDSESEQYLIPKVDIRYSYFIKADAEGNIINSSPELGTKCSN
tara:strand:- start:278 stop:571 length:294 start_codon:yes stop_codon:yes gene_type:complete